ncbi:serine hydrolase [Alkaliphilus serpentinus]|uniref:Serine hydrolase n=1 Tax=Alkaliphilus serpentinus TaxID=1482731 RepID=A0A833MDZ1_9FIRM|nr:serine hydrolase [Alkaliphilus serpentinus]KAB3529879.1 serine hydrolase [Alkaliphilus serpentinus]
MKKRLLLFFLILVLIFSTVSTFAFNTSEANNINPLISVDGQIIDATNYEIYISEDGTIMYPLRLISEGLGAEVGWEPTKNSASVIDDQDEIWINPNTKVVTVNGVEKKLDYPIEFKESRIYVTYEFISEILGARFEINADTKAISLQKPSVNTESLELTASQQNTKDALVSYLTSLELHRNFSGQILVAKDNQVLIDRSYGYSDYENHIKAFNTTTFAIGSVTKQFTAAAIIQLAEDNMLSYDDKVSKYFSEVSYGDEITIHQLLTHTSGLYNYTMMLPEFAGMDISELTFEKIISLIQDKPLDFEPGKGWNYSNTGYLILGEIVEQVSGETLEKYLQDNIFIPLGMENTGVAFKLEDKLVEANGYSGNMDVVLDTADSLLLNVAYGAGFLHSTAQDLYKWNRALHEGKIVSTDGLVKMYGKSPDMELLAPYGYGLMFNYSEEYGEEIFHGGNTIGFTSENAIFTDENTQIIILTNKGYADLTSIKYNIASILKGNVVAPLGELTYITVSEEQLSKYTGTYEIKDLLVIDIFVKDGKLMLQGEGQPAIELEPLSETKYESSSFGIAIEFDSKDTPKEFILYQAGQQFTAQLLE